MKDSRSKKKKGGAGGGGGKVIYLVTESCDQSCDITAWSSCGG